MEDVVFKSVGIIKHSKWTGEGICKVLWEFREWNDHAFREKLNIKLSLKVYM